MNKTVFMRLWDIYNGLLTPTQQEITNLYFNLDLTVSEIAEEKGISRQAVSECLKTCKKQFEEYESKLKFLQTVNDVNEKALFKLSAVREWADEFFSAHTQYSEDADKLKNILNKDVSTQVTGGESVDNN